MLAWAVLNFLNLKLEFLLENEFLRKTVLACLFGAQIGWINELQICQKSRDIATLKCATWNFTCCEHRTKKNISPNSDSAWIRIYFFLSWIRIRIQMLKIDKNYQKNI